MAPARRCWATGPLPEAHMPRRIRPAGLQLKASPRGGSFAGRRGEGSRTGMGEVVGHASVPEQVTWEGQSKFRAGKIHRATLFMAILHA